MADVTTYARCLMPFVRGGVAYHVGDVLPTTNAAVTQSPAYWTMLTDAEMSDGKHGVHNG